MKSTGSGRGMKRPPRKEGGPRWQRRACLDAASLRPKNQGPSPRLVILHVGLAKTIGGSFSWVSLSIATYVSHSQVGSYLGIGGYSLGLLESLFSMRDLPNIRGTFVGILVTRARLFGFYIRAPDIWKLPYEPLSMLRVVLSYVFLRWKWGSM